MQRSAWLSEGRTAIVLVGQLFAQTAADVTVPYHRVAGCREGCRKQRGLGVMQYHDVGVVEVA